MILRITRNIVVHRLQLIQHILDGLHQHGLQAARKRVWVLGIVLLQCPLRLRLLRDRCSSRLPQQHELRDRVLILRHRICGGPLRRSAVLLADVVQDFADGVADGVF